MAILPKHEGAHPGSNDVHAMAAGIVELLEAHKLLHLLAAPPADDSRWKQPRHIAHRIAHLLTSQQPIRAIHTSSKVMQVFDTAHPPPAVLLCRFISESVYMRTWYERQATEQPIHKYKQESLADEA